MVSNAMLAAGVGQLLGLSIEQIAAGLEGLELSGGRLRRYESGGVVVFDDTYNANPDSVIAAIETLAETESEGAKYVVLGKMAELGEHAEEGHKKVGRLAAEKGLNVVSVGVEAEGVHVGACEVDASRSNYFAGKEEAAEWLLANARSKDMLLFKGSRSAAMEQVNFGERPWKLKKQLAKKVGHTA